jgi:uncharacterized protein YbcI
MQTLFPHEEQKNQITHHTSIFLDEQFGFSPRSVTVLTDDQIVVIRVEDFLSAAEVKMGTAIGKASVIRETYSKLFDTVKRPLINQVSAITSKEVLSSLVAISFETKLLLISFLLGSNLTNEKQIVNE